MEKSKLHKIRFNDYHFYTIENYIDKEIINFTGINPDGSSFDAWTSLKNNYAAKIHIETAEKKQIYIPLKLIFSSLEDWEIFSFMAIIENSHPIISYEFYKIGEQYGQTENTIVRLENVILKSLFCLDGENKIPIKQFAQNLIKRISTNELNIIVENYLDKIDDEQFEESERDNE